LAEEEKDGALAPAEPQHTPLSEIVDKPRISDTPAKAVVDAPEPKQRREPKPEAKPDDEARFRGLLNETLTEREKRQAAERERDQYKQAWTEHQQKLAADQERDPAPDQFRDPQKYNEWVERQVSKRAEAIAKQQMQPFMARVSEQQLTLSEMRAEKALGADKWTKLNTWIEGQPEQFKQWAMAQPDPYWAAYEQYRQRTTFERLGNDDIDTLIEKEVAKRLAEKAGPIDPPDSDIEEDDDDFDAPKPKQAAPRSFASARSADPSRDKGGRFTGPRPLGELVAENNQRKKR
jgi:hypothetical protein